MGLQLMALSFTGYWLVTEFREVEKHHHKRFLQENMEVMLLHSMNVGFSMARYYMSKNPQYLSEYNEHINTIKDSMVKLEAEAQGPELALAHKLRADADELVKVGNEFKSQFSRVPPTSVESLAAGDALESKLSSCIETLETDVRKFEESLQLTGSEDPVAIKNSGLRVLLLIAALTGANILLAILMGAWFSNSITGRLKILMQNTLRLSRSQNLHPRLPGSDEIAHLDRVFHDMANALAEAARKERAVVQHAADVICSVDSQGRFSAVSPASLQVWGYAPEELIGRNFSEIIAEEDRQRIERAFKPLGPVTTEPQPLQSRVVKKDGSRVHILWSAYWAPSEQSTFCVAHDITDRQLAEDQLKASEARTRSIFESAPIALLVVDELGVIKMSNPKVEVIFGYRTSDIAGRHVSLLMPKSADLDEKNFREDIIRNMVGRVREVEALSRTGRIFPVELSIENYLTDEGERFLAAIVDVTERHEVERLRRDFVSTVSHELRTPLTAIRASLTLLAVGAMGKLGDQAEKAIQMAERNSLRLINLINDLLDIEKLEAGKLEMIFQEVRLEPIIERSLDAVRGFAEQYGINTKVVMTHDERVVADADRLVQVLVNLLSNAIKYSPSHAFVTVNTTLHNDMMRISVVDRGRGIPAEYRDRIFERFQQVEVEDATRKGGSGLGLAICKAIIEQHGGTLGVDSNVGSGSTFWFEVPVAGSPVAIALAKKDRKGESDEQPGSSISEHTATGDGKGPVIVARELNNVADERA